MTQWNDERAKIELIFSEAWNSARGERLEGKGWGPNSVNWEWLQCVTIAFTTSPPDPHE